jgi:hypothetical protein
LIKDFQYCNVEHDAEKDGECGANCNKGANIETWVGFRASLDGGYRVRECGAIEKRHIEQR